ncbi:MAG: hypothetical protein M3Y58_03355 [Chloroflexota bacterium]|nr:hypothetical protein [Chloroflexota bacterium]
MTKRQKREQTIRRNPRQVRFDDLDNLMTDEEFNATKASSHVTYRHPRYRDLLVTVVEPHGGTTHVNRIYMNDALTAIDEARRRTTAEEDAWRNAQ